MSGAPAAAAFADGDTPVRVERPASRNVPLVYDSPHSGARYPADFRPAAPMALLIGGEDRFVDQLVADAPSLGIALVAAEFPRTYVDPNRAVEDIDPLLLDEPRPDRPPPSGKSSLGVGLIFRLIGSGTPIYDRKLRLDEVRRRVDRYWRPYHQALADLLEDAARAHGAVWHVNWHSMQSIGNVLSPDPGEPRPDFALGDLHGRSCDPAFTAFVADRLTGMGYSVCLNQPYAGAEIVERYGDPKKGRHSLQIEIKHSLYMDEDTLEPHGGFDRLRADIARLSEDLAAWCADPAGRP